jgi:hypothetical protein
MAEEKATAANSNFAAHVHNDEKDRHIDLEATFTEELAELELKLHVRKDPESATIGEELRTIVPLILKGVGFGAGAAAGRHKYGVPTSADGAVPFRPASPPPPPNTKGESDEQATEAQLLVQDIVGGIVPLDDLPPGTLGDIERILRSKTDQLKRLVEIFEDDGGESK